MLRAADLLCKYISSVALHEHVGWKPWTRDQRKCEGLVRGCKRGMSGRTSVPVTSSHAAQVLNLDALPGKMAIVGGGYIALEFAGIYNNFGTEVHVLWRQVRGAPSRPLCSSCSRCPALGAACAPHLPPPFSSCFRCAQVVNASTCICHRV